MTPAARLIATHLPPAPEGAVLVLHGGGSRRGNMMVSPAQLSVLRMVPIAHRIAAAGSGRLAVFRLLNSIRGWDSRHTPVEDARWALSEIASKLGGAVPTCLVGHSLGGRAALLAARAPSVISVVALAPWVYRTDGDLDLTDRRVLIVHGSDDTIASPQNSVAVATALSATAQVSYIRVAGGKHAMLKHHELFGRAAADFAAATVLGQIRQGVVARLLAGEHWITVP